VLLSEDCPKCPWGVPDHDPVLDRVMQYLALLDAGCPVGRNELTNEEWLSIGMIRAERTTLNAPSPTDAGWQEVPHGR
jgi:hypothetical protein